MIQDSSGMEKADDCDALSLEERIQRLENARAVEGVLVSYARCVDRRDAEGVAALFTANGVLRVPKGKPLAGREHIARVYRSLLGALAASTHVVSNFETQLAEPCRAKVKCVLWAWEGFESPLVFAGPCNRFSFGRYEAELVCEADGCWRIEELVISFAGQTEV